MLPTIPDHELIRCIGRGAYGEVWLARNVLKAYHAIKIVYRKSFRDEHTYEREFRGIQQFEPISRTNESLLDILQAGRDDETGHYYYVMELADDGSASRNDKPENENWETYEPKTLATVLRERERLPPRECVELGLNLTLGIGHLHRGGLIHRDIKPANIIFVRGIPKLADIGLVTTFDGTCSFVGTEGFIAPEGPTSPRADIFSLGKVLYEISTGKDRKDFPEPATGLGERSDGQDLTELNAVILKACAIDPKDRYQSAEEFHAELAVLHSGRSVKWRRKVEERLAVARKAGAVVALVAALASGAYLYQRHQTREAKRLHELAEGLATRMQIQNAENLLEKGDSALGLAHLAHVLRRHPQNRVASERIVAALTQRNFPRQALKPLVHQAKLITARFSPDGERIVTASEDHSIHIWGAKTGQETTPPFRLTAHINSIEFSPDSSKLAVASSDGAAQLLDLRTGTHLFPPFKHNGTALTVKFDPSGEWIATGWDDSAVRVFSVATGELFGAVLEHESPVKSLDFSPDGRSLVTLSGQGSVRIWEFGSGELKKHFQNDNTIGITVRFSGDGQRVAAAFNNHAIDVWQVNIWNLESGQPLSEPLTHGERIYTIAFSPDNQRLLTADADNVATVWSITSGKALFQIQHSAIVYSAAFSPDGQKILTASVDHTARLWNASTGASISEPFFHDGRVVHAEFSFTGEQVLTASWDRSARIWDIRPSITPNRTLQHSFWVAFAEFDRTGERAITATKGAVFTANDINTSHTGQQHAAVVWQTTPLLSQVAPVLPHGVQTLTAQFTGAGAKALLNRIFGRQARIRDLDSGIATGEIIQHADQITAAHFSPDGSKVATGSRDGAAAIWDARQGIALLPPFKHQRSVNSVRFSPDGGKLVTASNDGSAIIWDVRTGQPSKPLRHNGEVWFAQFSPAGDKVVTVSLDHSAKVWSAGGDFIAVVHHSAPVEYAEFSPDGAKLVTASGDRTARLWDALTGRQLTELQHAQLVMTARFSPDGLRVITASKDGTAQLWDAATGLKLADPFRHGDWVLSASFSPDATRVITASMDGTARIWEVALAQPIPSWLPDLAEAVAGQRLNHDRIAEPVSWAKSNELRARLNDLSGTTLNAKTGATVPNKPRTK